MELFGRFKKKEEKPAKEDEPEKNVNQKAASKGDAAWATSKEKPAKEKKEEQKMAETKKKTAEKPEAEKKSESGKVWHITKRADDGKWQVKAEGAEKATKLFRTKAEAEEYVKTLKANNEGSRVVKHKKTGEFQNK